ncbi:Protein EARLY FLOWERING 3 [Platanthera guangdongensis]|uniref:Protein EARLY FLOWERING 3 n=1 Tax=Platanthera guangdongensis TaxID=2320717 RepID=A0ABR2N0T2_9ASPA
MKGGKEADKTMRPMFPRLHVNDTDKGGPRAPPRNKMSLYEQLSIPSNKFISATLPPHKPGSGAPSASSSQERTLEKTTYSPFHIPYSTPAPSAEKPFSQSSDGKSIKNRGREFDISTDYEDCKSSRVAGLGTEGNTFNVHDLMSRKNSFKTKYEDDDDYRVPTLVHAEVVPHSKDASLVEVSSPPFGASNVQKYATLDSSVDVLGSSRKPIHEANATRKLSQHEKNHGAKDCSEDFSSKDHGDEYPNNPVTEILADSSKNSAAPTDRGTKTKLKDLDKTCRQTTRLSNESPHNGSIIAFKSSNDPQFHENINTSNMSSELSSGSSSGNSQGSYDDKVNRFGELKNTERTVEFSEASMIDSIYQMELSPDDVVGVIGPKQFWKARREIVNQQRIFAIQVFELHRLIKVQKLFAASPHLFLDDSQSITIQTKASAKIPPISSTLKCHSSDKPSPPAKKPSGSSLQTRENYSTNDLPKHPQNSSHSTIPCPIPLPPDNRPNPWCSRPPTNQWLIPVMSPSEGLIYKPYVGLCPPNSEFMAPLYGSCGPLSMSSIAGNFMNAPSGLPSFHQQQNSILPGSSPALDPVFLDMPSTNPVIAKPLAERVRSPLTSAPLDAHAIPLSHTSCNMSILKSDALPVNPPKVNTREDNELQGSTASSPCDRAHGKAKGMLTLFPTAPETERSSQPSDLCGKGRKAHQSRVIRVVPHNARSTADSAARIFRSIQEERQQTYSID